MFKLVKIILFFITQNLISISCLELNINEIIYNPIARDFSPEGILRIIINLNNYYYC